MKMLVIFLFMLLLSSCTFAGDPDVYGENGFFMGLWHGMVSIGGQIISIFNDDVRIYALNNSGWFYNLFFLVGAISFSWNIGLIASLISLLLLIL
jgi:hypothetical protein